MGGGLRIGGIVAIVALLIACDEKPRRHRIDDDEPPRDDPSSKPVVSDTSRQDPPPPPPPPPSIAPIPPLPPPLASSGPSILMLKVPLGVTDPKHVPFDEILDKARGAAISMDEHSQLVQFRVARFDDAGVIDVTTDTAFSANFEYRYFDKTKRPGEDLVAGMISVSSAFTYCDKGAPCLAATRVSGGAGRLEREKERPVPKGCSLVKAWAVALKSGVPAGTVATVTYGFWPGPPYLWDFSVDGHKELDRTVNAGTCAIATPDDVSKAMMGPGH